MNRYVEVKAAAFNGAEFDGCPFSDLPEWLTLLETRKQIGVARSDTDYAVWSLEDNPEQERMIANDEDHPLLAWPGDLIVFTSEEKGIVIKYKSYRSLDNETREELLSAIRTKPQTEQEIRNTVESFSRGHR